MTRRPGVTLVEVLVAIFVMAIGLIALLTLFPIGVLRMAQALRDERCSECGYNADKIAIMHDIRNDTLVVTAPLDPYNRATTINDLFLNPGPFDTTPKPLLPDADPYGESYPILVDPIGYLETFGAARDWVGGSPGVLRRRPVTFNSNPAITAVIAAANARRSFTLWDDINFDGTNIPGTPQISGATILRETRYSWAYLLRRPQASDRSVVDCSIIVFDQRSLSLTGSLALEEYVYQNTSYFNPTDNAITIDYTNDVPPPVRVGDWILDATFYKPTPTTGSAHAYFYRVVSADDFVVAGKTYARYGVQNPIRGFVNVPTVADPITPPGTAFKGTAIVIRGIAEVMDRGPVRMP